MDLHALSAFLCLRRGKPSQKAILKEKNEEMQEEIMKAKGEKAERDAAAAKKAADSKVGEEREKGGRRGRRERRRERRERHTGERERDTRRERETACANLCCFVLSLSWWCVC